MSSVQVTPRKRKVSATVETPRSAAKGKSRGLAVPSPPLAPFPTPPHTRHRKDKIKQHVFAREASLTPPPTPSKRNLTTAALPPHLQTLLTLHHAYNLALSLRIATHPPVLPPHPPSATKLPLTNLTNFIAIKNTVERSSGRRFGLAEFGRLAWIWSWDGRALPDDKVTSENSKKDLDDDNPFLVRNDERPSTSLIQVSGLSYVVTPSRTLDPQSGRRVHTYGLGIELDLKPGETRQITLKSAEGDVGNKGQGGGTGAIARWNASAGDREDAFRARLERWVALNGGYNVPTQTDLPTPSASKESPRSSIPPIPLLPLPHLPVSTLLPAADLFSSTSLESLPGLSSSPRKPISSTGGLADPFDMHEREVKNGNVIRKGSVDERKQAMLDRIKARSGPSKGALPTLGSSVGGFNRMMMSAVEQQEELKRRSTLSRLEGIAEGVWMMFSAPSPGPSTLPTPPRGRRKAIPMSEVAEVIVKSSKTPISIAEAQTSLQLLTELCPFFLNTKTVAKQDWLEMPSALANSACPPSPSSSSPGSGLAKVPEPPSSPTFGRSAAKIKPDLAGPASPGRVRRVGGLREVRERIRRELGE